MLKKQEIYWKQRSKQFWLQAGDQNTRFFHNFATGRRRNNQVHRLKNKNGEWRDNEQDVQGIILDYFVELFASSRSERRLSNRDKVKCVTEEHNVQLIKPISNNEVKDAVFSMHPEKGLEYDGLNPAFNQAFWKIIEKDVVRFCQKHFSTGELPMEFNCTIVCLIPKVK